MRRRLALAAIPLVLLFTALPVQAGPILTGSITDWVESSPPIVIGDGIDGVTLWWSINTWDRGWFYGSMYTDRTTDVAVATDITDVAQITDAGAFSFTDLYVGPICDADCTGTGVGTFLVFRNILTMHYGVLRVDDIVGAGAYQAYLNATWWFQSDGSGDFSDGQSVPDVGSTLLLLGLGLAGLRAWKHQ
jgi:hypothetical protein